VRRSSVVCFFLKVEEGIGDWLVTGVQTCALPICDRRARAEVGLHRRGFGPGGCDCDRTERARQSERPPLQIRASIPADCREASKIGRGSCRGRGGVTAVGWIVV